MSRGKQIALTPARRMVLELLHHAKQVPSLPLSKEMRLGPLIALRKQADVSWTAIFMKAFGLVAREAPELRRAFIPYPWQRYYEHHESIAAILLERVVDDRPAVLGARIRHPEIAPLPVIENLLRRFRDRPVDKVSYFRQALRIGRMPGLLRRFIFWHSLYFSGKKRAGRYGTFMISSLGNLGVEQFHPLTVHTTYLTYGPIDAAGNVCVKIIYDHRVLDGREAARALVALEEKLNGAILQELQSLAVASTRAA